MKIVLLFITQFLLFTCAFSQLYYLTGRPYSIERNNAIIETGIKWGIEFQYVGSDVIDEFGVDEINGHNDSVSKLIQNKRGIENDWMTVFYTQVDQVESFQNNIRAQIKTLESFKQIELNHQEIFVLIHKNKPSGKWHSCIVFEVMYHESKPNVKCIKSICYNERRNQFKVKKTISCNLPYEIPQNGVVN